MQLAATYDEPSGDAIAGEGLVVHSLDATLFAPDATPLFNKVKLRNHVVHEVLQLLLLTRAGRKDASS